MHMHEQWRRHCTSQWGWWTPLSERVYCVAVTFKMTERGKQCMCTQFCVKLEHSSMKTTWMIQKATAVRNRWLTASSGQCTSSHNTSCAGFLVEHQIAQVIQPPDSPDLVPCDFWVFLKLKSPLKGKRFQTIEEIQENTTGQLMAIGRTVWGPRVPTLKGTEVSLSYVQCFLYLVSSSINVSYPWLNTFWTDLIYNINY